MTPASHFCCLRPAFKQSLIVWLRLLLLALTVSTLNACSKPPAEQQLRETIDAAAEAIESFRLLGNLPLRVRQHSVRHLQ